MSVEEVTIRVFEGNDPAVTLAVTKTDSDGVTTNYDFDGVSEIHFYVKKSRDDSDGAAMAHYTWTGGEIQVVAPAATSGRIQVQMAAADLAAPGVYRYRVDTVKGGRTETIMFGPFAVVNV